MRDLPLKPSKVLTAMPPVVVVTAAAKAPIATSPLPLQSMISITLAFPSEVVVNPIDPGSTYQIRNVEGKCDAMVALWLMKIS